jgi:hypothetical protein
MTTPVPSSQSAEQRREPVLTVSTLFLAASTQLARPAKVDPIKAIAMYKTVQYRSGS